MILLCQQPIILWGNQNKLNAETSLAGLYACGEVASTDHGANRLASNSLLEAVVLANRGAAAVENYLSLLKMSLLYLIGLMVA